MTDQELITIERQNALTAFETGDGLDEIVRRARDTVESFEHDMSTKAGRSRTASLAHKVARLKVKLDDAGKDLVSERKKQIKLVDDNRRKMRDELDSLKIEARKPLTNWEKHEDARVNSIKSEIERMSNLTIFNDELQLEWIEERLCTINDQDIDPSFFQEFESEAHKVKAWVKATLEEMIQNEKNRLELERLKAEEEARKQRAEEERRKKEEQERIERIKKEAAEKARREAEEAAKRKLEEAKRKRDEALRIAKEQEERAKQAEFNRLKAEADSKAKAELAAKQARLDAEREAQEKQALREAQEKQKKLDAERKEAERKAEAEAKERARIEDKKHRDKVHKEMLSSILNMKVERWTPLLIAEAIIAGKLKHVTINY